MGIPCAVDIIYYDSRCIAYLFQKEEMAVRLITGLNLHWTQ